MEKSEYEKILSGLSCPDCGGKVEVKSPPVVIVRGEEELEIPGKAKCLTCGENWKFYHSVNCPECNYYTKLPTQLCPVCGVSLNPAFEFELGYEPDVFCKCEDSVCVIATKPHANLPSCPLAGGEDAKPMGYYTWYSRKYSTIP
jgi:DNA-directed RNA polymerase subunit RPC12/RpoP